MYTPCFDSFSLRVYYYSSNKYRFLNIQFCTFRCVILLPLQSLCMYVFVCIYIYIHKRYTRVYIMFNSPDVIRFRFVDILHGETVYARLN